MDAGGVDTVMLLGSNGEGAMFAITSSARFAAAAAAEWRRIRGARARLFVTVFAASTAEAVARTRSLLPARPDAVVLAPPHYFVHTERELVRHFRTVAGIGVPVIVYNIPRYTGNPITAGLLEALAGIEGIVGIKDSGGDEAFFDAAVALQARRPAFGVSQGNENQMGAAILKGARGITPGLANLAPGLCRKLFDAARRGDAAATEALQASLSDLMAIHNVRRGVAAMKAAMSLTGLAPPLPAAPIEMFSPQELHALRAVLEPRQALLAAPLTREAAPP
jgi:4-hydroxy-tetrahydrodipicolinate synthase